jgi:hypothetical protein
MLLWRSTRQPKREWLVCVKLFGSLRLKQRHSVKNWVKHELSFTVRVVIGKGCVRLFKVKEKRKKEKRKKEKKKRKIFFCL